METQQQRQVSRTDRELKPHIARLVLASGSPRRADILRAAGFAFDPCSVSVDESHLPGEHPIVYVERLAAAKAQAGAGLHPARVVLGADTVVVIEGEILGKPRDETDARRMLSLLSGAWHEVLTGVALVRVETTDVKVAHEVTKVKFAAMTAEEIEWYLTTGEAIDKAGAYAIQGRAARFIEGIEGDYLNVVGLPLRLLYQLIRDFPQGGV